MTCFECDATENLHHHHVVPRSLGGTKTIPLCERCHGLVHSKDFTSAGTLVAKAMQKKKAQGLYTGGRVPFGFKLGDDGETLVPNSAEIEIMLCAQELHRDGHSLRGIAAELARQGMFNRKGDVFGSDVVLRSLLGKKPKGLSLREIATELANRGMFNRKGEAFAANVVKLSLLKPQLVPQASLFGGAP